MCSSLLREIRDVIFAKSACKIFLERYDHYPGLLRENAQVNVILFGKRASGVVSYCGTIRSATEAVNLVAMGVRKAAGEP